MRDVVSWVTQMRLSAPPRPQLFLPVRQISHVWLLKTPSPPFLVHQSHILRCICVSRGKMLIFSTTYRWLVLQVPTRRAAVTSTVSSATTTARTRTRWGCTREPRIFISLQCNMCNGQCKQEKVSEEVPGRAGYWKLKEDFLQLNVVQVVAHRRQHQKLDSIMAAGEPFLYQLDHIPLWWILLRLSVY